MSDRIFGIGTDIVRVARMEKSLARYGEKFARRILTELEMEDFSHAERPAHFLARRFAAKEAAVKALGTGFGHGITPRQIGVGHEDSGKPVLLYYGKALALMKKMGISGGHISIADEEDHAVAFVTLLAR
ncbi:MAG: holo-ACP synthase [Gammaproteobacteria bacterium]|nr:holo-ACP synthase [Gammaproteobacteria bacterium]